MRGHGLIKLFIVGNGFDIAHQVKSKYKYFRKYLLDKLCILCDNADYQTYNFTGDDVLSDANSLLSEAYDIFIIIHFLSCAELELKDDKSTFEWNNIESSVGILDYSTIYNLCPTPDEEDYEHYTRTQFMYADIFNQYKDSLEKIPHYFSEWIRQIDISTVSKISDLDSLFDNKTLFINFNYTNILEEVYGIPSKNILYIHGKAIDDQSRIYFGHGNEHSDTINRIDAPLYITLYTEEDILHKQLRKPVEKILDDSREFFKSLNSIEKVYSYGFSYSKVDMIYMKEINK